MGYGEKVKKWFFDEEGDDIEEYDGVLTSKCQAS